MTVHMALTGSAGAVRAVVAAVADRFTTAERQVPRAPGMLRTRIYDVDAASIGAGQRGSVLAPAESGSVHVTLTGDNDDIRQVTSWITDTFRSEGETVGGDSRMSFDVYAHEPSMGGQAP